MDLAWGIAGQRRLKYKELTIFIMTNRREFLIGCSTLALAAGFTPASLLSAPLASRNVSLDQVSFATLTSKIGTEFTVSKNSSTLAILKLVEAKLTPATHPRALQGPDANNEKFSLMFCGRKQPSLTQDTHVFEHAGIGRFEMFIVPVGFKDSNHTYYQAIFNRPASATST
jgi:hypothetical protein